MSFNMKWDDSNLKRLIKEQTSEILSKDADQIERAVRAVTCPEHGGHAKVQRVADPNGWSLRLVQPCCEELEKAVAKAKDRELQQMARRR